MLHCAAFTMPDPSRPGHVFTLSLPAPADMQALWRSAGGTPAQIALSLG
jgi:hypothetical protein